MSKMSEKEIFYSYKRERNNLYDYYCLARNVSKIMGQLDHMLMYSCLHTLANKYKSSIRQVLKNRRLPDRNWGISYETKQGTVVCGWKRLFATQKTFAGCAKVQMERPYTLRGVSTVRREVNVDLFCWIAF